MRRCACLRSARASFEIGFVDVCSEGRVLWRGWIWFLCTTEDVRVRNGKSLCAQWEALCAEREGSVCTSGGSFCTPGGAACTTRGFIFTNRRVSVHNGRRCVHNGRRRIHNERGELVRVGESWWELV